MRAQDNSCVLPAEQSTSTTLPFDGAHLTKRAPPPLCLTRSVPSARGGSRRHPLGLVMHCACALSRSRYCFMRTARAVSCSFFLSRFRFNSCERASPGCMLQGGKGLNLGVGCSGASGVRGPVAPSNNQETPMTKQRCIISRTS